MNLFITGANQGIGYYLAAQVLEEGNAVSVLDVETDRLTALAAAHPGRLLCHRADVRDAEAVRRAVEATAAQFGRIDGHPQRLPLSQGPGGAGQRQPLRGL